MKFAIALSVLVVVGLLIAVAGFGAKMYENRIYPGVRVGDINIGNKTTSAAVQMLARSSGVDTELVLVWDKLEWKVNTAELELEYLPQQTVKEAMKVGRQGNWIEQLRERVGVWKNNQIIGHKFRLNEDKLTEVIDKIAGQINVPASEPEVKIDKDTRQIMVTAGENGQEVDGDLLKLKIKQMIGQRKVGLIEVPIIYLRPKLSAAQIEMVRKRVETLVGKRVKISFSSENREWLIGEELLVSWIDPQGGGWKRGEVENWIVELAKTIDKPAQNASFRFIEGGKVEEFKPAILGYRVKQDETVDKMMAALIKLENEVNEEVTLAVETIQPDIKTEEVNNLGIKELIGKGESWFSGSITNRIYNLARSATAMNGVLVPPGEEFSFNKAVGEVSAATGYKQAYVIKGGKTILGDGGGVCQTSTTLFRAVLDAGLPIEERFAHAYRVSYYEQKYQPGFDATIFQPAPDFRFRNDTLGHILIQTKFDEPGKHLVIEIYGSDDGRIVEISKARTWEVTPPPPDLYIDDPNLAVGKIVQTEHAAWGAKVAFDWTVTRAEETLQKRTFYSNYSPWQAVFLRGTKI